MSQFKAKSKQPEANEKVYTYDILTAREKESEKYPDWSLFSVDLLEPSAVQLPRVLT